MIRKYHELLPAYLDGPNIRKHAKVIERETQKIDNLAELLRNWNNLERPILIERYTEEPYHCIIYVHVNLEEYLKKVTITVEGSTDTTEIEFPYSEDGIRIDEFTIEDRCLTKKYGMDVIDNENPLVMPNITVKVETFEEHVYEKGYPENDIIKEDIYDHDEFLDIMGKLLGIPRRVYRDWTHDEGTFVHLLRSTYPTCFAKYDEDGEIIPGTEDDWYYYTRLKFFVENYGVMETSMLMNKLVYEQDIIDVYPSTTSHVDTGETYYYSYLIDSVSDFVNIDHVNQNRIASAWLPVTRPARFSTLTDTLLWVEGTYVDVPPNAFDIQYMLITDDGNYYIVDNAPICVSISGVCELSMFPEHLESGYDCLMIRGVNFCSSLVLQYMGEHELNASEAVSVPITLSDQYSLSLDDWEYTRQGRYSEDRYVLPSNSEEGLLAGQYYFLYVPVMNMDCYKPVRITVTVYNNTTFNNPHYGALMGVFDHAQPQTLMSKQTEYQLWNWEMKNHSYTLDFDEDHIVTESRDGVILHIRDFTDMNKGMLAFGLESYKYLNALVIKQMTVHAGLITITNEQEGTFNLTEWTGTGGTNRSIDQDGTLLATNTNNYFNKYINGTEWEIRLELSVSDLTSSNNTLQLTYDNTTEGHTVIRYQNGTWTFRAYELVDGTQTQISSQDISAPFTSTDDKVLFIISRNGNKITFQYGIKTNGNPPHNYSRTYTNAISDNSRLRLVSHADAYWKVHSLKIRVGDDYTSEMYTQILNTANWQAYTTNWATATNKPTVSGTQLTFNTTHNYLYTIYSLKDFLDETGRCRLVYKKGGANGYANLTFANPTTGDEIGLKWTSSNAPYYKWVNTAENYEISHNYQICYLVWNEVIITKDGNNLVFTFHWQDGSNNSQTGYGVFTIPIGSINLDDYYLNMYRSSGGTLYLNTDYSIIQHPARES